jgi:hypothetical protein
VINGLEPIGQSVEEDSEGRGVETLQDHYGACSLGRGLRLTVQGTGEQIESSTVINDEAVAVCVLHVKRRV